jgi:O-antigen biosynthesis protein
MKVIPEGIGFKGLVNLVFLAFNILKKFGFRTLWRKVSYKLSLGEEKDYDLWINRNEPTESELNEQRMISRAFSYRPLISIIMPVFNPPINVLKEAIESIIHQTYGDWELCIADGSDPLSHSGVKNLLIGYMAKDLPIKVVFLNKNKGISGNSNKALEVARGEFIALVDQDDHIAPWALFRVVERLNLNRDADVFYSDRDLLSWDGKKRSHPFIKPDWSPENLVSVNYLIHLAVIRKSLVDRAGGFWAEMDGAQDWDLFFRVTEMTSRIVHIPEILYHWRVGPQSAAWSLAAKPYVVQAQFHAIKNHFKRAGIDVEVSLGPSGFIKIKWMNRIIKKVSMIMAVRENLKSLIKSLQSMIQKTVYPDYEIILVGKKPEELQTLKSTYPDCPIRTVSFKDNRTLPGMYNLGADKATGEFLVFMADNLEVLDPDWLNELVGWVAQKEIGAVGGKIMNADRTIHSAGLIATPEKKVISPFSGMKEYYGKFGSSEWYRNYQAVSEACLAVRKDVFEEVHQFDTNISDEDNPVDFCSRLHQYGYRTVYSPYARLRNLG